MTDADEFAEEIRSHLDHEVDRLVASGMSRQEASHAARRTFGNVTAHRERHWHASPRRTMALHLGRIARRLLRTPAFTVAVVAILAAAFAALALSASLLYATRFRPLPVADPSTVMAIWANDDVRAATPAQDVVPGTMLLAWRDRQQSFSEITAYTPVRLRVADQWERRFEATIVDGAYFSTLQLPLALGRGVLPSDCVPDGPQVVVLSDSRWRSDFHADPAVIGRSWRLDGAVYTIVGVTAPLANGLNTPAWISAPERHGIQPTEMYRVYGRLKPGVTAARAAAELATLLPRADSIVAGAPIAGVLLWPIEKELHATSSESLLAIAALALLALVALLNLGTLFLVRVLARLRQVAISVAIGATAGRLRLDAACEGALLGAAGGVGAVVIARGLSIALQQFISEHVTASAERLPLPALLVIAVVLAATLSGASIATLAHGVTRRLNVATHLAGGGAAFTRSQSRWRLLLVGGQVCVAVLSAVAATRLIASVAYIAHIDVGFESDHLLVGELPIWDTPLGEEAAAQRLADQVERNVSQAPGLGPAATWATVGFRMPQSPSDKGIDVNGDPTNYSLHCHWNSCPSTVELVSDHLFTVFGIPVLSGRAFGPTDRGGAPVAIVNAQAAAAWFHGSDPIGRRVRILGISTPDVWRTVVGVVGNTAELSSFGRVPASTRPGTELPLIYVPIAQSTLHDAGTFLAYPLSVAIRPQLPRRQATAALRRVLVPLAPSLDAPNVLSMTSIFEQGFHEDLLRLHAAVVITVAGLTLVLALIGVAGVVAEGVRQRQRELGIRMALGCTALGSIRLVSRDAMALAGGALAIGVGLAVVGEATLARIALGGAPDARPHGALLAGPDQTAGSLIVTAAVILLAAGIAALLPALSAARLNPAVVLRDTGDG